MEMALCPTIELEIEMKQWAWQHLKQDFDYEHVVTADVGCHACPLALRRCTSLAC